MSDSGVQFLMPVEVVLTGEQKKALKSKKIREARRALREAMDWHPPDTATVFKECTEEEHLNPTRKPMEMSWFVPKEKP